MTFVFNDGNREWRKTSGHQPGLQAHDHTIPSPTVSASRKKQKTSQSVASLSLGAPPPALRPAMEPASLSLKRGPPGGSRGKTPKPVSSNYVVQ